MSMFGQFSGLLRLGTSATRQLLAGRTSNRSLGFWHQADPDPSTWTEVCFVDPRLVIELQNSRTDLSHPLLVTTSVPPCLLQELPKAYQAPLMVARMQTGGLFSNSLLQGVNELGDTDDPENNWYFGKRSEIFQYQLIGTHPSPSGFTSIVAKDVLQDVLQGRSTCELPTWQELAALIDGGDIAWPSQKLPFLFAGRVVDSDSAAVYQLKEGQHVAGLLISSEAFG